MKVFIFEGPACEHLRGWRHYQIRQPNRVVSFTAEPKRVPDMTERLNAEFFAAGTWEAEANGERFPLPRRDILERLSGGTALTNCAGQSQG